ncbi:NADP-dependent oxidoreductase domain-containing protein [Zychaea mexicana]|uniref:NADP-dependent oxidoreductase domain-containing protein n=1 Tax=Zychaea mexicana TaxID=64656 RepID=UPI0022FE06FD|nr:NADP-dependent oxidoreductase domain-containing protein [Zychaea mexicana]KAI9498458.1 NADP-dependent oxidoreductase domain-containing protein [Zychaea mexicana]
MATKQLHNGDTIPVLGLGTYRVKTEDVLKPVVHQAIQNGYRLIDSATVYRNEEVLGRILKEVFDDPSFGVQRQDMFITSKLSPQNQGYDACYKAVTESLERFGLEYFDLYLIHWPGTAKKKLSDPINQENRMGSYRALETLHREGKVRHIGISNYTARHLQHLLDHCEIVPHVHQFELHPRLVQQDILDLCDKHHIQVQAYSSLGEGKLLTDEDVLDIVKDRNVAQVLLRWAVQHGWIVIPKSSNPDRVSSNAKVLSLELSDEDMKKLDAVHQAETQRFCWDPSDII